MGGTIGNGSLWERDRRKLRGGRTLGTMSDANGKDDVERVPHLWRRALSIPEGKILIVGIVLTILYVVAVALTSVWSGQLFQSLWTMTGTHILGGRFAGMLWGFNHRLPYWLVVVANMIIESYLVLLFYPLFVFSYNKLIVVEPLRETMERTQRAAEAHHKTIVKYGVPGLLLFVWFPFWMTGPLVGCVIGFLIGLRPWVNLTVVLIGTYVATFCWGLAMRPLQGLLEGLGPYVPLILVGLILLVAVSIRIRYAFSRPGRTRGPRPPAGGRKAD
jgi:uncharacterized membrane protein